MPRARPRPSLTLDLSPAKRRELAEFAAEARRRAEAARARKAERQGQGRGEGQAAGRGEARAAAGAGPSSGPSPGRERRVRRARRSRIEGLVAEISRLRELRARRLGEGAFEAVITLDRQLKDLRFKLANAEATEAQRAEKLSRRGRGKSRDRFAVLVGRAGGVLQPVHLEIADALRDAVLSPGSVAGLRGALSGRAGDGEGNAVSIVNLHGETVELGEDWWGGIGVPGAGGARGAGAARRPQVKRTARGGDGGMAAAADSVRRARALMRAFGAACAEAAGEEGWAAQVAVRVILLNRPLKASIGACAAVRYSEGLKIAEAVMAAGLEGVATRVGVTL